MPLIRSNGERNLGNLFGCIEIVGTAFLGTTFDVEFHFFTIESRPSMYAVRWLMLISVARPKRFAIVPPVACADAPVE